MEKTITDIKKRIKEILTIEYEAVKQQCKNIDSGIINCINEMVSCKGKIVVMGIGKSGIIGRKIAATMVSFGIPATFVYPVDLTHGDLGIISPDDMILMLSYSGMSDELKKVFPFLKKMSIKTAILTGKTDSILAKLCDFVINTKVKREACRYNLAPTSSTTAMLAVGDAIALTVAERKGFTEKIYARYHPGGTIGKKLTLRVSDLMHTGKELPLVDINATVRNALIIMTEKKFGAVIIIDKKKTIAGYFTDGDLRRKLQVTEKLLDMKISLVMTKNPVVITGDKLAAEAGQLMKRYNCDNLPVIDKNNRPVGIIDERDLIIAGIV